jgi:hypothetical protein
MQVTSATETDRDLSNRLPDRQVKSQGSGVRAVGRSGGPRTRRSPRRPRGGVQLFAPFCGLVAEDPWVHPVARVGFPAVEGWKESEGERGAFEEGMGRLIGVHHGEPDAVRVARPVRRAGRRNPPSESRAGRSGPTPTRDEVASFIASDRTEHRVPHATCWRWLGVSESWFYRWHDRDPPPASTVGPSSTRRSRRRSMTPVGRRARKGHRGCSPIWSRLVGRCRSTRWRRRWPAEACTAEPRSVGGVARLARTRRQHRSRTW